MKVNSQIAILLFCRTPRLEAKDKNWLLSQDSDTNELLARAITYKTKKALSDTGIPVVPVTESMQVGHSFGERLAHAMQHVFDLGYQSLICVGNDCLELNKVDFQEVALSLASGNSVLGPDFRNGAYLIALARQDFHQRTFAHLSWQTEDLFEDLKSYCPNPIILEKYRDLNDSRDLYKLKKENAWLRRLLRQLITFDFNTNNNLHGGDKSTHGQSRRGPPAL